MLDLASTVTGRSVSGENCRNDALPPTGCAGMCSTIDLRVVSGLATVATNVR